MKQFALLCPSHFRGPSRLWKSCSKQFSQPTEHLLYARHHARCWAAPEMRGHGDPSHTQTTGQSVQDSSDETTARYPDIQSEGIQPLVSTKERQCHFPVAGIKKRTEMSLSLPAYTPVEVPSLLPSVDWSPLSSPHITAQRVTEDSWSQAGHTF